MSVEAACIDGESFLRPHVDPRIRVPKIRARVSKTGRRSQVAAEDLIEERWN